MVTKTGVADLPLHRGKAPRWLFSLMKELARNIVLVMVEETSSKEVIRKLSDPFWFQAFGCVLGFDWHSSGLTTTVCGALKEGLKGLEKETGIFVCGGKGGTSRRTPEEIRIYGEKYSLEKSPEELIYASRMSAKVDSTCIQNGYTLYHHSFIFTREGDFCVIQQGMNPLSGYARRYHWLSEEIESFVCEPHKAICCNERRSALNMVAKESEKAREVSASLSREEPDFILRELKKLKSLKLPPLHQVFLEDINPDSLRPILLKTYESQIQGFEQLLSLPRVGPKTIRALALISDLAYGAKPSLKDPVTYSFAHGGKDGHPYPVKREEYERTVEFLKKAIEEANLGRQEKLEALRRLKRYF